MKQNHDIRITQRRRPHWTLEGAVYFVTFSLKGGCLSLGERQIVHELIIGGNGKFYDLISSVVMPTHVHCALSLLPGQELWKTLKRIKGVSARYINKSRGRAGSIWSDESYDHIVRNENSMEKILDYIERNPVKSGLISDDKNYPFYFFNENW